MELDSVSWYTQELWLLILLLEFKNALKLTKVDYLIFSLIKGIKNESKNKKP